MLTQLGRYCVIRVSAVDPRRQSTVFTRSPAGGAAGCSRFEWVAQTCYVRATSETRFVGQASVCIEWLMPVNCVYVSGTRPTAISVGQLYSWTYGTDSAMAVSISEYLLFTVICLVYRC